MIWAHSVSPFTTYVAILFMAYAVGAISLFAGWVLYCLAREKRERGMAPSRQRIAEPSTRTAGAIAPQLALAFIGCGFGLRDGQGVLANKEPN